MEVAVKLARLSWWSNHKTKFQRWNLPCSADIPYQFLTKSIFPKMKINKNPDEDIQFEPAQDKTYNKPCVTSENSDQPAHPRSLIRVFTDRMCLLRPPGCQKRNKREHLPYWVDVQADLSLYWLHRSYCRFCCAKLIYKFRGSMPVWLNTQGYYIKPVTWAADNIQKCIIFMFMILYEKKVDDSHEM